MLSQVLLEAAAHEAERSALLPELYDIVWSGIIFVVILAVVWVKALPKYNALADARAEKIREGIEMAEKAKADTKANEQKLEAELALAREEATKIRESATAQAADIVARAQDKANEESKRILDNAQRQIAAEKQSAQVSLRSDVGLLAVELAEKIVGEQLKDKELSARVVDRFLDDLEGQTAAALKES